MVTQYFLRPRVLFVLALFFIFAKIYQHNLVINLIYEKQRLETTKKVLLASKNRLLAQYLALKNYKDINAKARDTWGMKPINVDQIITPTTKAAATFFPMAPAQPDVKIEDTNMSFSSHIGG